MVAATLLRQFVRADVTMDVPMAMVLFAVMHHRRHLVNHNGMRPGVRGIAFSDAAGTD